MNNGYMNSSHNFFVLFMLLVWWCWRGSFFFILFRYCIKEMMCDVCVCVHNLVNDDIEPISIFFSLRHLKFIQFWGFYFRVIVFNTYAVHEMLFFLILFHLPHGLFFRLDIRTNNVTRIIRSFLMGTENDFISFQWHGNTQ